MEQQAFSRFATSEYTPKYKIHPKVVTERLGHSDVSTTLRLYAHVIPSMQEEAAEMIDEGIHTLPWEE
jgi:integrase